MRIGYWGGMVVHLGIYVCWMDLFWKGGGC